MKFTWTKMMLGMAAMTLVACGGPVANYDGVEVELDTAEQAITCSGGAATCGYVMASLDGVGAKSNGSRPLGVSPSTPTRTPTSMTGKISSAFAGTAPADLWPWSVSPGARMDASPTA